MTRYGSLMQFKETFCSQAMMDVAKNPGRAYFGAAPTLEDVRRAFGGDADIAWLCTLLDYFIEYSGRGRLSNTQIVEIAKRLSMKPKLRVTEFMLFFWRLGNAEYGIIYRNIDPLFIMDGFKQFLKQRESERGDYAPPPVEEKRESGQIINGETYYKMTLAGETAPEAVEMTLKLMGPY